jgi:hypothetical protein
MGPNRPFGAIPAANEPGNPTNEPTESTNEPGLATNEPDRARTNPSVRVVAPLGQKPFSAKGLPLSLGRNGGTGAAHRETDPAIAERTQAAA